MRRAKTNLTLSVVITNLVLDRRSLQRESKSLLSYFYKLCGLWKVVISVIGMTAATFFSSAPMRFWLVLLLASRSSGKAFTVKADHNPFVKESFRGGAARKLPQSRSSTGTQSLDSSSGQIPDESIPEIKLDDIDKVTSI